METLVTTKKGDKVSAFGLKETKFSRVKDCVSSEMEQRDVNGVLVYDLQGIFAGTQMFTKAEVKTSPNGTQYAATTEKLVGLVNIAGFEKPFKLTSSDVELKVGETYNFQLRTSKRNDKPVGKETEFLQASDGSIIMWLVKDKSLEVPSQK